MVSGSTSNTHRRLGRDRTDETACARTPEPFYAVGLWYGNFSQTTDEEVHDLLERVAAEPAPAYGHA
jgi:putative phosphoribosyl transferase